MDLIQVYRVEGTKKSLKGEKSYFCGPYRGSDEVCDDLFELLRDHDFSCPCPSDDGMGHNFHGRIFGFLFMEDLIWWFNGEKGLSLLRKNGFEVKTYNVPYDQIVVGNSGQICFPIP